MESQAPRQLQKRVPHNVPRASVKHFNSQAWLQDTLHDPAFRIVSLSRETTNNGQGHTLMGRTWNTDGTIQHALSQFRLSTAADPLAFPQSDGERAEVRRFYTFGPDLTAHPNLLHGGVVACVLDSSLGRAAGLIVEQSGRDPEIFTVQLNITYKKPIPTPGTVATKAWVTKVEGGGRKIWAKGVVEGRGGVVHAVAEGMWLRAEPAKQKL